jgi:hypothetical protein
MKLKKTRLATEDTELAEENKAIRYYLLVFR